MKQQVTPAIWAIAVAVALLVLAFIGWKSFGGSRSAEMDTATIMAHQAAKKSHAGSH